MDKPYLINFSTFGKKSEGFLSVAENQTNIPFEIKRVFWTYKTPTNITRGRHAHYSTEMVLIAMSGSINVECVILPNFCQTFVLEDPNTGLYIPKMCWHTMEYQDNTTQLVITNTKYSPIDYIRDYEKYKDIMNIKDI